MSDNIKVVVKVRPLICREIEDKLTYQWRVKNNTLYQLDQNGKDVVTNYTFDKVYGEHTKTSELYNDIAKPIVQDVIKGFNGTIFAYGQTSSGKTFTMMGTDEHPGIIPLAVLDMFETIKNIPDRDFLVRVSYLEIYNETIQDLLNSSQEKKTIKIHETLHGIKVDVQEKMTSSPQEVLELMRIGQVNRQIGSTNMNEESSRSHTIFQITVESREHAPPQAHEDEDPESDTRSGALVNVSVLNLVDLAGSERAGQTGATGQRFLEGTHINKSLSTLAGVIRQLADEARHVSYRDSKLTRILQNSLGGNAKTTIVCAVTPASLEETVSTLQFAMRAKAIKNKPEVIVRPTKDSMIQGLTKKLGLLQSQLESKKNIEQVNVSLQRKIAELQQLIINGFSAGAPLGGGVGARGAAWGARGGRRATISTLPSTELRAADPPPPAMHKFCTPTLKYNPLVVGVERADSKPSLSAVPEEGCAATPSPPAATTTPPRTVSFCDKVVEIIDSDDEENLSDLKTCSGSPTHQCYNEQKTPPCILRKNAKLKEKEYKDLQELTELEKMYPPKIVDLLKQLKDNASTIYNMEEQINLLNKQSKQKDFDISILECKVNKTEEDIRNLNTEKLNLETKCKEIQTKLTDSEVMLETLKNKSKMREDELLSLLEESKNKKILKIGVPQIATLCEKEYSQFMDISKDISLVNSDNESSIIASPNKEMPKLQQDIVSELAHKNLLIKELEADISKQKLTIENIVSNSEDQIKVIDKLREQLSENEKDKLNLLNTIERLNVTIKSQESALESAQKDIKSCNDIIKDLQIKLASREYIPNMNLSEDVIEGLIANEDKLLANNENMLNIIHSLKKVINVRNKEIDNLMKAFKDQSENIKLHENMALEVEKRDEQIKFLNEQLQKTKTEKSAVIDGLLTEKQSWVSIEKKLKEKLQDIQEQITTNDEINLANNCIIEDLKNHNESLNKTIQDQQVIEEKLKNKVLQLLARVNEYTLLVSELQSNIEEKDNLIIFLKGQSSPILSKTQPIVSRLNHIHKIITGNPQVIPDFENLDAALDHLQLMLNIIETTIKDIMSQNTILTDEVKEFKSIEQVKRLSKIEDIEYKLDQLTVENNNLRQDSYNFSQKLDEVTNQYKDVIAKYSKSQDDLANSTEMLESLNNKHQAILEEKDAEIASKSGELVQLTNYQNDLLENLLKIMEFKQHNINLDFQIYNQNLKPFEKIIGMLQTLYDNIPLKTCTKIPNEYSLVSSPSDLSGKLEEIRQENKVLNNDLSVRSECLQSLHSELKEKSREIGDLQSTVQQWKDQFLNLQYTMNMQLNDLRKDNLKLRDMGYGVEIYDSSSSVQSSIQQPILCNPPSLVAISCDRIKSLINVNAIEEIKENIKNVDILENNSTYNASCQCPELSQELEMVKTENTTLLEVIRNLQHVNQRLIDEQETIREDILSLVEPSKELQKKISNHRTTLSTLTATTYAEHQLLKTRLTALQHHHTRFHNICLRDLPSFKEQLEKLMIILKGNSTLNDSQVKRYSLPNILDSNCSLNNFKNESAIDPDLLMMDTNMTMTTINNTLMCHDQTCLVDMTQTQLLEADISVAAPNLSLLKPEIQTQETKPDITEKINELKNENDRLREEINKLCQQKHFIDAQCSPIKNETVENIQKDVNEKVTDILQQKVNMLEQDCNKLKTALEKRNKQFLELQEENDSLSNQIFENVTEVDMLKKELDKIKQSNVDLESSLQSAKEKIKQDSISRRRSSEHSPLNRSLSDSDSVSSYNKICTLQNEICAVKEDCKQLTHEVTTIQNHLEQGDISGMELDNSIEAKDLLLEETSKINRNFTEKMQCFNFFVDVTESDSANSADMSVVDMMKLLYEKMVLKHSNEVENLLNQLKDFQETKYNLEEQIKNIDAELLHHVNEIKKIQNILEQVRSNIDSIKHEISDNPNFEKNSILLNDFEEKVLKILDGELRLSTTDFFTIIFDSISKKHEHTLIDVLSKYNKLQEQLEALNVENNAVNNNLAQMKQQMDLKEKEYNILKCQKEKMHEISSAVTLNIIKKDQELNETIRKGLDKLLQHNINIIDQYVSDRPASQNLDAIFEYISLNQNNSEKDNLIIQIKESKSSLADKENELKALKTHTEKLSIINEKLKLEINDNIVKLDMQNSIHEELKQIYHEKVNENNANIQLVAHLSEEIGLLKETISQNEEMLQNLHSKLLKCNVCENCIEKDTFMSKLSSNLKALDSELKSLKQANEIINKEKDALTRDLEIAEAVINQNKLDIDKMNADILILRESTKDNVNIIHKLSDEAKSLIALNAKLKEQFDEKRDECSKLQINIKTHEKTAEIQSKMIIRLQNEKETVLNDKVKVIEELTQKLSNTRQEYDIAISKLNAAEKQIELLQETKADLEIRVASSQPIFPADGVEELFSGAAELPGELADEGRAGRGSRGDAGRRSEGRSHSRLDQCERGSGAGSLSAARRRRQSEHDLRRTLTPQHSPRNLSDESKHSNDSSRSGQRDSELAELRRRVEELEERNRELDEECDTCAAYLREREEQCRVLRRENRELQNTIDDLKHKLSSCTPAHLASGTTPEMVHASVNTDQAWAHLHSVVVDRMSFDAEVDKNKRLSRVADDLRRKKHELRNTVAQLQRALERGARGAHSTELEELRSEVESLRHELSTLQDRNRELVEQCEARAQRASRLQAQLEALQSSPGTARRRRQELLDQRRRTHEHDIVSYHEERDDATNAEEVQQLKMTISSLREQLSRAGGPGAGGAGGPGAGGAGGAVYVATGSAIVQSQQITDVMKENQKLKNINSKLIKICKKRGKSPAAAATTANRENEDPARL